MKQIIIIFISVFLSTSSFVFAQAPILQIIDNKDGLYLGNITDGKYNGSGIMMYRNGDYYIGTWTNGVYNGPGILAKAKAKRDWDPVMFRVWDNGKPVDVIRRFAEGEHTLYGNTKNGSGVFQSEYPESQTIYIGDFINNEMSGFGLVEFLSGDLFIGYMKNKKFYKEEMLIDFSEAEIKHMLIDEKGNAKVILHKFRYPDYFF